MSAATEVIEMPQSAVATQVDHAVPANSPVGMMMAAMQQGIPLEQIEKAMDLQERWEAGEARKAYTAAMSAFKAEHIQIMKAKKVSFNTRDGDTTSYSHAELSDVTEAIDPAMAKHDLSYRWNVRQEASQITVECIITHIRGHSETVMMVASPDTSGKKNAIQQVASTVTYLQRYTLLAATGMSTKGQDDDAQGSAVVDQSLVDDWVAAAEGAGSLEELDQIWKDGIGQVEISDSLQFYARFKNAVTASKKKLQEKS